ncbi:MAG: dihydropteroate synthase [Myxococcales bacterium]|nr:dihydropteroate synthase [Myxococcales bacterium]
MQGGRTPRDDHAQPAPSEGAGLCRCALWGVLNVTPDSFSDGGLFQDPSQALARGLAMRDAGADVIDVGGESTRPAGKTYGPGYEPVSLGEEIQRTEPVVAALVSAGVAVSIDTTKPEVARRAARAGALFVNDVSMGASDALLRVVAEEGLTLVLMHNRGRGEVAGAQIAYDDVVNDVLSELSVAVARAVRAGVPAARVWIDPGIGFAKTAAQSAALIARTEELARGPHPVLVGPSRKSFIAELAPLPDGSRPGPEGRLFGTAAAVAAAVLGGAAAVRVHDVAEMRQVVDVALAMRGARALPHHERGRDA